MQPDVRGKRLWWSPAIMAVVASGAFAADCDVRLTNSVVDYGVVSRGELGAGMGIPFMTLGTRKLTLTAVCHQATTMALRFEGESAAQGGFRFASKGWFTVKVSDATLDGNAVLLAHTTNVVSGSTGGASAIDLRPDGRVSIITLGQKAVGKVLSAQIEIEAFVDDASTRVRGETVMDGSGALVLDTP